MTQNIYNLVFYSDMTGLKYINIDDRIIKEVSMVKKGKSKKKYNIELLDNITSFYTEENLRDLLNIKEDGYFFIISQKNNTYYKRHAIFDDEDIYYLTENIYEDVEPKLLSVDEILENEDFVSYLNKESSFYNVGNKKLIETINKLDILNKSKDEDLEIEEEKKYLKKYYSKNIDSYLKYRDFYVAYRDYTDKAFIREVDEIKEHYIYKRKEEELVELVEKYNHDEIDEEQYNIIRKAIMDDITEIKLKKYDLEKAKKRIIKK